ncbi:ADP-ribose pyrophosphatase YjhB (NUDIX family) [Tumebacillus sp. BK434]|uniref:NUDIX domain-containing protein n=1 Tax=Tumebacillus sp. BK434 TaxID=2512169 RepID=UPI0010EE640E|nr:NUDIX hydrolase [Tumebacillus sp. BK434]TCP54670.1 ADP-ribose pyrophosphatase YjhB (NUDIX family) [Tumebacillus sp. BK434]
MEDKRGNIWLAVSGLVINEAGKCLVVKKSYSATKGLWTLPSGFVRADETVDAAVVREVREETGLIVEPEAVVAVRTGVLRKGKHDTLLVFRARLLGGTVTRCERELLTVDWLTPEEIASSPDSTEFLATLIRDVHNTAGLQPRPISHTRDYGYSEYKIFF